MKNKRCGYLLIAIFSILYSCKYNRELTIENRLKTCLSDNDILSLKKSKENRKGRNLYITEVQFNFEQCVGLFRYEYANARLSAGISNYVLRGKDKLFFKSKNVEENKMVVNSFIQVYGDFFSESEKKYIETIFIETDVKRGNIK